jgi:putative hydrolase of the HAD superfamily
VELDDMTLKAVFFDMGGTIETFHWDKALRVRNAHFIRECLEKGGINLKIDDEKLAELITDGIADYHKWNTVSLKEISPARIWSQYILRDFGISETNLLSIGEELAFLYEVYFYERKLRPEIPEVLKKLSDLGLKIGCISNVSSRGQVPYCLKKYGIMDYFDPIILSSEYGRRKPDPSIFHYAARLVGMPTSACAYVGDRIERDIMGAKNAGFSLAIQIEHDFNHGEDDIGATPDAVIGDMRDLIPLIEEANRQDQTSLPMDNDRPYRAIFFDAGDILYHRPNQGKNFNDFLSAHGSQPTDKIMEKSRQLKEKAFQGHLHRLSYYEKVVRLYGVKDPEVIEAGIEALKRDDLTVEIIPGVPEVILELKRQGYLLGIITDTALPIHIKLKWFRDAGIGHIWDTIISSCEMGVRKPARRMYQEAVNQVGVSANRAIFIGHKKSELDGAKAMGMTTIAYNYEADAEADHYLNDFKDLLDLPILSRERVK